MNISVISFHIDMFPVYYFPVLSLTHTHFDSPAYPCGGVEVWRLMLLLISHIPQ